MLPHGPRPTTIARNSIDAPRAIQATNVSPIAARDRGLGDAYVSRPVDAERTCSSTNDPVTTPANAGWRAGARLTSRRPLASITACPTWAANPSATRMTPSENRSEERTAMVSASRGRGPAGLRSGRLPDRDGAWLDLEDQAAVRARVHQRQPAEAAHRADHGQRLAVRVAADHTRLIDETVPPAM